MRLPYWLFAVIVVCGVMLGGCGGRDNKPTPPSDATTDTPVLDIDEGSEVPADVVVPPPPAAN
ncbi:MAG: hypothetical protein ACYC6N_23930 [Pirellulaceae bacterium]